ncbi:MAG: membrane protein insertase YidC [Clostridia bacterium]|nr:membrane protein insertase YidC [Clostridia bacterium]
MDLINLLGAVWPEGNFWASLIKFFDVGNYAWTIILFTLVLKLVLSPLDFLQRYYTNKTTRMQAKIQPEMEKLKKRYGQNQTLLYQKQNELYKKNNISMKGSCIVMLVYMAVTLTVFLTFYSSLQTISGANIKNQYEQLESTYTNSYEVNYYNYIGVNLDDFNNLQTKQEKDEYLQNKKDEKIQSIINENLTPITNDEAEAIFNDQKAVIIEDAQIEVANKYIEIKDSWLWIKNVWRADNATISEIPTYDDYKALTGETSVSKTQYNLVMAKLLNNYKNTNQINGYYILSVIVVAVSFLSQWLTRKLSTPKTKDGIKIQQPGMSKILMFLMPVMMLMFTLSSSAIFAMYIIVNTLGTTLLTPITTFTSNKIADKVEAKQEKKRKEALKVDYRR